jgi:hypothetical protein
MNRTAAGLANGSGLLRSGGTSGPQCQSKTVVFPLFLWLGTLGRHPLTDRMMTAISVTLFGCLIAMFVLRVDFALA